MKMPRGGIGGGNSPEDIPCIEFTTTYFSGLFVTSKLAT